MFAWLRLSMYLPTLAFLSQSINPCYKQRVTTSNFYPFICFVHAQKKGKNFDQNFFDLDKGTIIKFIHSHARIARL